MTTKEYVGTLDFQYVTIFSLLREVETKDYVDNLQATAKTIQDESERKRLIDLTFRGTKQMLIETGKPHPTARQTKIFRKSDSEIDELLAILSTDYTEQYAWMCWPIFREMIVFYDKSDQVVSLLNICLSCDQIEDGDFKRLETDFKVFNKLRSYFKGIGHMIEQR